MAPQNASTDIMHVPTINNDNIKIDNRTRKRNKSSTKLVHKGNFDKDQCVNMALFAVYKYLRPLEFNCSFSKKKRQQQENIKLTIPETSAHTRLMKLLMTVGCDGRYTCHTQHTLRIPAYTH